MFMKLGSGLISQRASRLMEEKHNDNIILLVLTERYEQSWGCEGIPGRGNVMCNGLKVSRGLACLKKKSVEIE